MRVKPDGSGGIKKKQSVRFREVLEDYSDYEVDEKGHRVKVRKSRVTRVPVEESSDSDRGTTLAYGLDSPLH